VTLTFDLLASGSMHDERLSSIMPVPNLVLIALAVFLSERGHRHAKSQTQLITVTHRRLYVWGIFGPPTKGSW